MRGIPTVCAAVAATMLASAAWADDPNDPAMRDAAARARDHEMTRQLNLDEIARVGERDARYAQGWHASRVARDEYMASNHEYDTRTRNYERARADYARQRRQYERDMAQWRGAVEACRDGDYSACDD